MPRHSPYALFRLNSSSNFVLLDLLNCLSFANNCFLGCELHKKTILFLNSTIFHPLFRVFGKIVFILSDNPYFWKDLLISKLKNLSIQLSVRFFLLYSVFNERLPCFARQGSACASPFAPQNHPTKKLMHECTSVGFVWHSRRNAGRPKLDH